MGLRSRTRACFAPRPAACCAASRPQSRRAPPSAPLQIGQATGISTSAATQASSAQSSGNSGTLITATGTTVPTLDPSLYAYTQVSRNTNPQTSTFVSGTNTLVTDSTISTFGYAQNFLTGTQVQVGLSNSRINTTALRTDLNPSTGATLGVYVTQPLLQGFGPAVNSRYIQIAKNNREASDLVFKQQVINIVASIINLYWDLVSFNEAVKVQQQAVDLNQKLLSDNKKQVEIGTLAPISVVKRRSRAGDGPARVNARPDPSSAAGNNPEERAQPQRCREPVAGRRPHCANRSYPSSRHRTSTTDPGYGCRSRALPARRCAGKNSAHQ